MRSTTVKSAKRRLRSSSVAHRNMPQCLRRPEADIGGAAHKLTFDPKRTTMACCRSLASGYRQHALALHGDMIGFHKTRSKRL